MHKISEHPNSQKMMVSLLRAQTSTPTAHGVTQKGADHMVNDGLLVRVTDAGDSRPSRHDDHFKLTPAGEKHARLLGMKNPALRSILRGR